MKRYLLISLVIFSYFLLAGCANTRPPSMNASLSHETWMRSIDSNPNAWAQGADRWFFTGDPNRTEIENRRAPYGEVISTMRVRVANFSRIRTNGDFQVQIFGTYGPNSVYIYGPNPAVRNTVIQVRGDTLCLDQVKRGFGGMHRVIIRIGINQFHGLTQFGYGCVEGIQLHSNGLTIAQAGSGNIYLAGDMNVQCVTNTGSGMVNVFGANTHSLIIKTRARGGVNVSGHVGVRQIVHLGANNINIIGASGGALSVYADGSGKIGINGIVNVCTIKAKHNTCVYINRVNSGTLYAYLYDRARVGVAGFAGHLYVDAHDSSQFEGHYLCTLAAFVRAYNSSHINVTSRKLFASATQNASVYFYGTPSSLSQFVSGNGIIIPIWYRYRQICPMVEIRPRISYKGENNHSHYYSPRAAWKHK